jgi:hypothetical protein
LQGPTIKHRHDAVALEQLAREARPRVARYWGHRAWAEHMTAERFRLVGRAFAKTGGAMELVELARAAIKDLRVHARACARVAQRYGLGEAVSRPAPPPLAPSHLKPERRALHAAVALGCVLQPVKIALMQSTVESAGAPWVREAARRIVREQARWSRLGWDAIATSQLDSARASVGQALPGCLKACLCDEVVFGRRNRGSGRPTDALERHGVLSQERKVRVFTETVGHVVLPSLDRAGVDIVPAGDWLQTNFKDAARTVLAG